MMSIRRAVLIGLCVSVPATLSGQASDNSGVAGAKRLSEFVKGHIVASAEQMPETNYAFKPTPEVRSFLAILGHIANTNYIFCSQAAATANPSIVNVEKTVTEKSAVIAALRESFAYCDKILGGLTDRSGAEVVAFPGGALSRLSIIGVNTAHNFEHYGNLITYLRLKGLVPPSSQPTR
jgi:hypothetical protein